MGRKAENKNINDMPMRHFGTNDEYSMKSKVRVIYGHSELVSESQTYSCSSGVDADFVQIFDLVLKSNIPSRTRENYLIFPLLWRARACPVLDTGVRGKYL